MILKKPYAFLIKHFQKIHIVLLVLCGYIFYKNAQFSSFVADYLSLGTYSSALDSVDQYVNILFYVVSVCILIITSFIIYLLHYKRKPYRIYFLIILEYVFMIGIFAYGANYFHSLTTAVSITKTLALRDLLFIASLPQYIVFILLIVRSLGIDLKKFGFQRDEEYLGLEQQDNEEFEFEVKVDKDKYKRAIKKRLRYLRYFYQENKKVVHILLVIVICGLIGFTSYYFGVAHKVYRMNQSFTANQYTIRVNKGYVTNLDYKGDSVLGDNSKKKFVILDLTVINRSNEREMNMTRFHLLNGLSSFVNTLTYNQSFTDLGKPYDKTALKSQEERTFLLIYEVDKDLDNEKFVLTYQEVVNSQTLDLKKIKLNLTDLSQVNVAEEKKLEEDMTVVYPNQTKQTVRFLDMQLVDQTNYFYEKCYVNDCSVVEETMVAPTGQMLMVISYLSDDFTTRELVDFSSRYGTISYIDNKQESKDVPVSMALNRTYQGNYLYLTVPLAIKDSSEIRLKFTIRDQEFVYRLR